MEQNNNEERKDLPEESTALFEDPVPQQAQTEDRATVPEQPAAAAADEKAQESEPSPTAEEPPHEQPAPEKAEEHAPAAEPTVEDSSETPDPAAEKEAQKAAKEAEKAEKERQKAEAKAAKKEKKEEKKAERAPAEQTADGMTAAATAAAPAQPNAQKRHFRRVRTKPRSYWIRRGRRRYLRRTTGRVFRFSVAMLLGIAIAFGSLAAGVFFALGGLTIDTLQRFGMAQDMDQYLTESGEIDLTATSILELVNDLNAVRGNLSAHTLRSLISRYGIAFPEHVLKVLPTDLFDIPLDQLLSENAANTVTEHLTMGYILQFLPQSLLHPQAVAVLSPRPLALLTNGDFGALLEGVQLGHVTGVTYDEQGNVQYLDPDCPTMQEAMASLDLGKMVNAVTKNGDMLAVIATDLAETDLGSVVSGMISGAFVEQMFEGRLVKDVILLNEETGRYEISFPALTDGLVLGDAMDYIRVDGVWYLSYTDNGDPADDVEVSAMQKLLADIPLTDLVNGSLSIEQEFDGLYVGDLQNGYVRGDAITEVPDGGNDPVTVGYQWSKDGVPVSKLQNSLANIAVSTLLTGGLDMNAVFDGLYLGDAMGHARGDAIIETPEGGQPMIVGYEWIKDNGTPEGEPLDDAMREFANIPLPDVLEGRINVEETMQKMTLAEAMGYKKVDGVWYSTYSDDGDATNDVKLTGILAVLAEKPLGEINSGTIDDIQLGTALGYELRDTDADGVTDTWYGKDGNPVTGMMIQMSDLKIGELSDPDKVTAKVNEVKISDVLDYKYDTVDKRWEHPDGRPASGVIAHMLDIDVTVGGMEGAIDDMQLGYALGLHQKDGEWLDENEQPPTGVFAGLADIHLRGARDEIRKLQIGQLMGYTGKDTDEDGLFDAWYYDKNDSTNDPVTGLTKSFAGLLVTELGNESRIAAAMQDVKLGESLGFKRVDGTWYKTKLDASNNTVADLDSPVTGLLGALADTEIGNIEGEIRNTAIGEMLDYTLVDGTWYETYTDNNDPEDDKPAKGILAVLADSKLSNLSQNLTDLKVNDVWPENERTGILKLLRGDEKITELNAAVTAVFADATIGDFLNVGVISISQDQQDALDANPIFSGWRTMKFADFFAALIVAATGK